MSLNREMTADPPLELDVLIEADAWTGALPGAEELCRMAASAAFAHTNGIVFSAGSLPNACILLASDERMRELNRAFRGRDEPTNVLSFPGIEADVLAAAGGDGLPDVLGDIVVAFETTAAEAAAQGISLADHLSHLVVHGMLHLLGYDHASDHDADVMEALESRVLETLGVADPYASAGER